ncbi:DUF1127 domain-containing protein [Aliihoeflea sp. PC F10.4]
MAANEIASFGVPCHRPPSLTHRNCSALRLIFRIWPQRRDQRARLLELEPHELRDIGIDRDEALREGCKPFWR